MAYRCDQAIFGGMRDAIRCKVSGSVCAHQKMCMMEGRMVLTDKAMTCPARGGQMPDDQGAFRTSTETPSGNRETKAAKVVRAEKVPDIDAAADTQVKTRGRKPAAATARKVTAKAETGTARKVTAKKTTASKKKV